MSVAPDYDASAFVGELDPFDDSLRLCDGLRLLVVGGGMAGFGFCDRLVRSGGSDSYSITLFGEEPTPAYDRVHLSELFRGRTADDLLLASSDWYRSRGIGLETGCRITRIDRQARQVVDQHGGRHPYDRLVLATGSRPRVPAISGVELPGVFVYRTLADLQRIRDFVGESGSTVGAVIGGGLLGLEAAKVLQDLGLQTSVIEMAPGLMPRQLDANAASMLRQRIEQTGVAVHLVRRTEAITPSRGGGLTMHFANARPLDVDVLIIAAGVLPNDDLASDCGLEIASGGGIVIDEGLQTSDPNIFAIGECASFRDHVYGLVAPCYRMADVLAKRLSGDPDRFEGADESAELKLLDVEVAALGRALGESPGGIALTQSDESGYRKLILDRGRIVGAASVGHWDELPRIRQAVREQARLWPWQRRRFKLTGTPWPSGGSLPVADWPESSVICACLAIPKAAITRVVADGLHDPDAIARSTGASTACGSCRALVCELAGGRVESRTATPGEATMLKASLLAALLIPLVWLSPPIPFADSVRDAWRNVDVLWRSDVARQITGFTLLTLLLIGLVFSLRKRLNWFRWGSYGAWRAAHGVLGTTVVIAIAVHTGLRLGDNLNLMLSTLFLAAAAVGSLAGILSGLEGRAEGARAILLRRWRPRLTQLHLWLFWPLPLLIGFHILSFYWFDD